MALSQGSARGFALGPTSVKFYVRITMHLAVRLAAHLAVHQ